MSTSPRNIASVGSATLASRVLGFVRDLLIARLFGADAATDAFFLAFKIPNLARRLFAEGAVSAALVPLFVRFRRGRSRHRLQALVNDLWGTLGLGLLALTTLSMLAAPWLILALAPGFADQPDTAALGAELLRWMLPYLLLIGLTAIAGALLNAHQRFFIPALTPAILNLSIIGCALWLAPRLETPILALAVGVLIGGCLQLLLQLGALQRLGLLPRPRLGCRNPAVRRLGRGLGAALFGVSVIQLNLLIDSLLASFLETGSVSWLYYAERLVEFPLGLLGVTLGVLVLPALTRQHLADKASGGVGDFAATLEWALRWVWLLGLPAAAGLILLADPLIATLFQSEAFGTRDVSESAQALMAYALGLVAFMAIKVLVPGFYGRDDLRTPLRIGVLALGANLVFSLALMGSFAQVGIALGTLFSALLNAGLLLWLLHRRGDVRRQPGTLKLLLRGLMATLIMGLILMLLRAQLSGSIGLGLSVDQDAGSGFEIGVILGTGLVFGNLEDAGTLGSVAQLSLLILGGLTSYGLSLLLLGVRPRQLLNRH